MVTFAQDCGLSASTTALLEKCFTLLTGESLNRNVSQSYPGLSRINANGFPFQWSLSLGSGPPSVRFLCEAGKPGTSASERAEFSLRTVNSLTDLLSFGYPQWLFDSVVPRILPADLPPYWLSAIWFALGANNERVVPKIYFNLNQGEIRNRWISVGWVLKDLNRLLSLNALCAVSESASNGSLPVGIAFDLKPDGEPGRVKVYFRSTRARPEFLERWYRACDAEQYSPTVRDFLDCFPTFGEYPHDAFVVGLEFPEETQNWCPTIKIDLAVTKWMTGDYQVQRGVQRALGLLDIPQEHYLNFLGKLGPRTLDRGKCHFHRFAGLGYEMDGSVHVNVYFEPFAHALPLIKGLPKKRNPSKKNILKAVEKGTGFLFNAQETDGNWIDFQLPVGQSDIWVTAYVLYQLTFVKDSFSKSDLFEESKARATNWLQSVHTRTGGWSYNSRVDEDSDSTSLAILGMNTTNRSDYERSLSRLLLYCQSDGGVSTYISGSEEDDGWATSHCDVTPIALMALRDRLSPQVVQNAHRFLTESQRTDGLWQSYWWVSPLYATYVTLLWLTSHMYEIPRKNKLVETLDRFNSYGAFETALHLDCVTLTTDGKGHTIPSDISNLLGLQLSNGSWPASAFLRLTHPEVKKPWTKIDAGSIFIDTSSVFTTATVLGALSNSVSKTSAIPPGP